MRQHPRPTYGKARGQWPPQLDKGDSSAQFHGQMESARRLSLTVEFSAPLRCVWQRVSLAREIFFMQGMKNGTECTLSRENETLPGAKPDSERNRYDPCTTERRRPRRPPKRAGREKGGAKNTDLPFRRPAWYIYMVVQGSRTRRARPLQLCPTQCNSPGSRRGGTVFPPRLQPTFSWAYPQWRTFVPAAKAASVHSCAHSAVRVGFPTPFLLGRHLAVFRPLRYPPHSILGHDSLSGPVSPQSHSYHTRFPRKSQRSAPCKTAVYCRTAKNRRSGAESPCFAGKKDV